MSYLQVVISNTVVTVNPTNDLITTGTKTYTVTMASGVIDDVQGNVCLARSSWCDDNDRFVAFYRFDHLPLPKSKA